MRRGSSMYNLGSLGSIDLEIAGTFQEVQADGSVMDRPFKFKARRMSTIDALEVLRECPVSMGLLADEAMVQFPPEEVASQRKKEHELMVSKAKACVPEDHHAMLPHIPYLNFLWLMDYLIRGDERAAGGQAVNKLVEAVEKQFRQVNLDGSPKKKQEEQAVS